MSLSTASVQTPPLWFVSDGEHTVGPVKTNTLLRGVSYGRVDRDLWAREFHWNDWRSVRSLREVRTLDRIKTRIGVPWHPSTDFALPNARDDAHLAVAPQLADAIDWSEVLLLGLHAAAEQVGATVGLVHRFRQPWIGMVTSCGLGPGADQQLGQVVPEWDEACWAACRERAVMGRRIVGPAQRAVARRLEVPGVELSSVAMLPIRASGRLIGMLELGKTDHPFRNTDKSRLEGVGRAIVSRLERTAWA